MEPQLQLFIAVFAEEEVASEAMKLAEAAPFLGAFRLTAHSILIRTHVADSTIVGHTLGVSGAPEHDNVGVVFNLQGSYTGYYTGELWEWLKETREASEVLS